VLEQARHDQIVHAREHARHVLDRLTLAEPDLLTEAQRVPAEQRKARLKRDARASGGLGEDHRHGLSVEGPVRGRARLEVRLDLLGERHQLAQLQGRDVVDVQKVAVLLGEKRHFRARRGRSRRRREGRAHRQAWGAQCRRHAKAGEDEHDEVSHVERSHVGIFKKSAEACT
jgi:hypothetical protein